MQTDELNNPLNDSIKSKDLFFDEVSSFNSLDPVLKDIYFLLLGDKIEFRSFFIFINYTNRNYNVERLILERFRSHICNYTSLSKLIIEKPIELAYCLSLINSFTTNEKDYSITPRWVLKNFPAVQDIFLSLRNNPCSTGCTYCLADLDAHRGLKKFFGYDTYRSYDGVP